MMTLPGPFPLCTGPTAGRGRGRKDGGSRPLRSARRHHILIRIKSGQRHTSQGHANRPHPEIHTPHQPAAWTSGRQQLKPQCSGEVTQLCARRAGREGGGCTPRVFACCPWPMAHAFQPLPPFTLHSFPPLPQVPIPSKCITQFGPIQPANDPRLTKTPSPSPAPH